MERRRFFEEGIVSDSASFPAIFPFSFVPGLCVVFASCLRIDMSLRWAHPPPARVVVLGKQSKTQLRFPGDEAFFHPE